MDSLGLSEREKIILTTTGSIFKKMIERKEELSEDEINKLQSIN